MAVRNASLFPRPRLIFSFVKLLHAVAKFPVALCFHFSLSCRQMSTLRAMQPCTNAVPTSGHLSYKQHGVSRAITAVYHLRYISTADCPLQKAYEIMRAFVSPGPSLWDSADISCHCQFFLNIMHSCSLYQVVPFRLTFPMRLSLVPAQPSLSFYSWLCPSLWEISNFLFSQRSFFPSNQSLLCPSWRIYFSRQCSPGERPKTYSGLLEVLEALI